MKFLHATLLALSLLFSLLPNNAIAGLNEGIAAYNKQDYATAHREVEPLANQGNATAQFVLGMLHENVAKDDAGAAKWYRLAASQGNANAQNNLGTMYANGQGVAQSDIEATKLYRLAANQGNANAQNNLGAMYANGQGVAKDAIEAVKWFRLAANQGNVSAQYNLGAKYANGQGVVKSDIEAIKWYRLAANQGHAGAKTALAKAEASESQRKAEEAARLEEEANRANDAARVEREEARRKAEERAAHIAEVERKAAETARIQEEARREAEKASRIEREAKREAEHAQNASLVTIALGLSGLIAFCIRRKRQGWPSLSVALAMGLLSGLLSLLLFMDGVLIAGITLSKSFEAITDIGIFFGVWILSMQLVLKGNVSALKVLSRGVLLVATEFAILVVLHFFKTDVGVAISIVLAGCSTLFFLKEKQALENISAGIRRVKQVLARLLLAAPNGGNLNNRPVPPFSKMLGIIGSFVLLLGVFSPYIRVPIVGSINYFRDGAVDGVVVVVMAILSLFFVFKEKPAKLFWTASGSLATIVYTFVYFNWAMYEGKRKMNESLAGNPFRGLADLAQSSIQIEWGWIVLVFGVGLLFLSAISNRLQIYSFDELLKVGSRTTRPSEDSARSGGKIDAAIPRNSVQPSTVKDSIADELLKLNELFKAGAITCDEFKQLKDKLIE